MSIPGGLSHVAGQGVCPCRLLAGRLLALVPLVAAAHEQRDVGDRQYSLEIGFRDEPAYLGQPNALYANITKYGAGGGPVQGPAATLKAEVQKEGATLPLTLVPQAEPGVYEAFFIPTALGDYTFRLFGDIEGTPIDESFTSSPNTFASVQSLEGYQFPVTAPAGEELVTQLTAANARADRSRNTRLHRDRRRSTRPPRWPARAPPWKGGTRASGGTPERAAGDPAWHGSASLVCS